MTSHMFWWSTRESWGFVCWKPFSCGDRLVWAISVPPDLYKAHQELLSTSVPTLSAKNFPFLVPHESHFPVGTRQLFLPLAGSIKENPVKGKDLRLHSRFRLPAGAFPHCCSSACIPGHQWCFWDSWLLVCSQQWCCYSPCFWWLVRVFSEYSLLLISKFSNPLPDEKVLDPCRWVEFRGGVVPSGRGQLHRNLP